MRQIVAAMGGGRSRFVLPGFVPVLFHPTPQPTKHPPPQKT